MEMAEMTPHRPYLLRAFYDWLLDNDLTPHLIVDVNWPGVTVPMEYVRDGQIILNIAPRAVGNLELGNEQVRFNARFGGVPQQVSVPLAAVVAIYARENGAGTMFEPEPAYEAETLLQESEKESGSLLSLVEDETPILPQQHDATPSSPPDDEPPTPPRGGRPFLRVVK